MRHRGSVGGIHFVWVVAATVQPPNILIAHGGDESFEFWIFAEKMLANIGAVEGFHGLIFAIDHFFHAL